MLFFWSLQKNYLVLTTVCWPTCGYYLSHGQSCSESHQWFVHLLIIHFSWVSFIPGVRLSNIAPSENHRQCELCGKWFHTNGIGRHRPSCNRIMSILEHDLDNLEHSAPLDESYFMLYFEPKPLVDMHLSDLRQTYSFPLAKGKYQTCHMMTVLRHPNHFSVCYSPGSFQ